MELDPLVVQGMISVPITIGLVVFTLAQKDRSPLHTQLAVLLSLAVVWMTCLIIAGVDPPHSELRRLALHLEMLSVAVMAPLFLVVIGGLSRLEIFEQGRGTTGVLFGISGFLLFAYLTDSYHQLFYSDFEAALRTEHPSVWGGPGYWAEQTISTLCCAVAIALAVMMAWRGRTADERSRALMILGATGIPVLAHVIYLKHLLPIDYSLAPGMLGVTAFFFVRAVNRHGFILVRPVMRQDVIEHMVDGILLADPQGVVLDANAAAETALGCERHELRGQGLAESLARLDSTTVEHGIGERIIATPLEGGRFREEIQTRDGRSIEINAGAVAALADHPAGRFVTLRDCSEQRTSERRLQQGQKLESLGILAAGVAHEVNNPLAYVRSNLAHLHELSMAINEALKLSPADPGSDLLEFPEVLEESMAGLDRIGGIVRGMLRFTRSPSEGFTTLDVNATVEDALQLAALHVNPGLRVERRLASGLPPIEGSAQGLVQVLLNLLINARQALTDRDDSLVVAETRTVSDAVEIMVEDNGPGIDDSILSQIFDPFFTTRDPGQGTGLGLSITFDIVRNHGGTLEYTPVEGGGARFVVRLPVSTLNSD